MTREELQDLLDQLGAPGPHWPDHTLAAMNALTEQDAQAAQDVHRARALDSAFADLSRAPLPEVTTATTSALRERILANAAAAANTSITTSITTSTTASTNTQATQLESETSPLWLRLSDWWLAATWRPAVAASVMLLIGLSLGINHGQQDEDELAADYADLLFAAEEPALDAQDWLTEEANL